MHYPSGEKPTGHRVLNCLRSPLYCCDLGSPIPRRREKSSEKCKEHCCPSERTVGLGKVNDYIINAHLLN